MRSFNFTLKRKFFQHQFQNQVKMFVSILCLVSHEVCIYVQYFLDVVLQLSTRVNQKGHQKFKKRICHVNVLEILTNEKQFWKTISQWKFDYGLFTNLPKIIFTCDFSQSSFKLKRGIL